MLCPRAPTQGEGWRMGSEQDCREARRVGVVVDITSQPSEVPPPCDCLHNLGFRPQTLPLRSPSELQWVHHIARGVPMCAHAQCSCDQAALVRVLASRCVAAAPAAAPAAVAAAAPIHVPGKSCVAIPLPLQEAPSCHWPCPQTGQQSLLIGHSSSITGLAAARANNRPKEPRMQCISITRRRPALKHTNGTMSHN